MNKLQSPSLLDGAEWSGLRVGLLGGSFNPAHEGHRHIALLALDHYGLDYIWWLVTPQNPLKDTTDMAPYEERFASAQRLIGNHPKMIATHLERDLGTNYTYETVKTLKQHFPQTEFMFICGMDNALIFHKWDKWEDLLDLIPITFIDRPRAIDIVEEAPLKQVKHKNLFWLHGKEMMDISSTEIRKSLKTNG
ncbi:MAG: nicotinate (nicotinamide) nucleotide adenylyltransferase [Micavibrio sp.]